MVYLVMELVNGELLNLVFKCIGWLLLWYVLDMFEQIGCVLQIVYVVGLVYCDVKLGNILIIFIGQVKIIDFGIVKVVDVVFVIQIGMVMGIV